MPPQQRRGQRRSRQCSSRDRDNQCQDVRGSHRKPARCPRVALTSNHAADQFLRSTVAVVVGRVDQPSCRAKGLCAALLPFDGFRMSSPREMPGALPERRGGGAFGELYRPNKESCVAPCQARCRFKPTGPMPRRLAYLAAQLPCFPAFTGTARS